ncbi:MAG TPA: hypothetical protein VLA21_09240, partial [Candidatus Limnocylindria bacterium]|nr:hypothetical protein [Candidatus Limnocylindria bacterium]
MAEPTLEQLRAQVQAAPRDPEGYLQLGLALNREGRLAEALDAFSRGLVENPFHMLLRQQRARKNMARNPWLALSDFTLVTRIAPSYWEGWYYMGVTYFLNDLPERARDAFTRCLQEAQASNASLIPVIDWLYTVHMKLGEAREAREALSLFTQDGADPDGEDYSYARRLLLYKGLLTPDDFF